MAPGIRKAIILIDFQPLFNSFQESHNQSKGQDKLPSTMGGGLMLKHLIESSIPTKNFRGIAIGYGNRSIIHWWDPKEEIINELCLDFEIKATISFQCIEGQFEFLEF